MMRAVPSSVIGRIPAAVPSSVPAVPTVPSPIPSPVPTVIRVVSRIPTPRRAPSPPPRAAPVPCGGAPSPQSEIDVYVGCSPVAVQGGGVFGFYEHLVAEDRHVVIGRIVGGGSVPRCWHFRFGRRSACRRSANRDFSDGLRKNLRRNRPRSSCCAIRPLVGRSVRIRPGPLPRGGPVRPLPRRAALPAAG